MSNPNDGPAIRLFLKPIVNQLLHRVGRTTIKSQTGLVQQQHFRIELHCPQQSNDLRFAAGKFVNILPKKRVVSMKRRQPRQMLAQITLPAAMHFEGKRLSEIRLHRPFQQHGSLLQVVDSTAKLGRVMPADGAATPQDLPAVHGIEIASARRSRLFPLPVGPTSPTRSPPRI